jgi:hypothetical protein
MALILTSENELNQVAPPALPQAGAEYNQQYQDQLNNVLRLYFNRISALQQQLDWAQALDYLDFNTAPPTVAMPTGRLVWNDTDATLDVGMEYGVVQQLGQELYARVQNNTGVTIPNGTMVGFAGATDDALLVAPYLADGSQPSLYILGVMTHDLPDTGQKGYCTTWGFVRGMNTSGFTQGDILYASPATAGAFTNVKPTAPDNVIPVAAVVQVGTTDGVLFVRPTIEQQKSYGTFSRTTDFSPAAANTAYPIVFTGTGEANGISLGTPASRVVVSNSGFYDVSATLQYTSTNSSSKNIYSWIRKNGVDYPQSSRIVTLAANNAFAPVLISEAVSLDAGDYIEVVMAATDNAVTLKAAPATAFAPGSPGVNLVVEQIMQ